MESTFCCVATFTSPEALQWEGLMDATAWPTSSTGPRSSTEALGTGGKDSPDSARGAWAQAGEISIRAQQKYRALLFHFSSIRTIPLRMPGTPSWLFKILQCR